MSGARYWSASKRQYVPLADLHGAHLQAAQKKLLRGEYRGEDGEPLSADEQAALEAAFAEEVARRPAPQVAP